MAEQELLVLVVCRHELEVTLVPPLRLIIPLLANLAPFRLYTSMNARIQAPSKYHSLYDCLVHHLENDEGECNLSETLSRIMADMQAEGVDQYRVCLLGNEKVEWGVVMELKRRRVVLDTANTGAKNPLLVQISYLTGGIHRNIRESSMLKAFQTDFMLSTKSRPMFKIEKKEAVEFSMECVACSAHSQTVTITGEFLACSVCLAVYCSKHERLTRCLSCDQEFD